MGLRKAGAVMTLDQKRILLVIGGGIAAYKSLDLVRRLRERGARVRDGLGIGEGHVTLTDEAGLVVAVAVLMRRPTGAV